MMLRTFTFPLLAYCLDCEVHYGPYAGPGEECANDCREAGPRRLVARRRWLCSVCNGSYETKGEIGAHVCWELD